MCDVLVLDEHAVAVRPQQLVGGLRKAAVVHRHSDAVGLVEVLGLRELLAVVVEGFARPEVLPHLALDGGIHVARPMELWKLEPSAAAELSHHALVRVAEDAKDGPVAKVLGRNLLWPVLPRGVHERTACKRRLGVTNAARQAQAVAAVPPLDPRAHGHVRNGVAKVVRNVGHGQTTRARSGLLHEAPALHLQLQQGHVIHDIVMRGKHLAHTAVKER
mmetsp:Transcript_84654/g.196826  ORF Transcript_84654/g.196826 Transcript_84654/m.196826 type:complete len:218 (-) Transcript_84654:96-749(-)